MASLCREYYVCGRRYRLVSDVRGWEVIRCPVIGLGVAHVQLRWAEATGIRIHREGPDGLRTGMLARLTDESKALHRRLFGDALRLVWRLLLVHLKGHFSEAGRLFKARAGLSGL